MDIEHQLCIGLLKLHVEGASGGTCKGGRQESTNKPSDLPPTACLVAARRASEKRKVLLERYVGKKKLTIRVVCSIRSSNVTSFFLSVFFVARCI